MEVEHFFLPSDEPSLPSELKNKQISLLPANGKESQTTIGQAFDAGFYIQSFLLMGAASIIALLVSSQISIQQKDNLSLQQQ